MTKFKVALAVVAVAIVTIVVIQNTEPIETEVLFLTLTLPRALLLALTFASGVIVGLLIAFALAGRRKSGE